MIRLYKRGGVVPLQNPRAVRCVSVIPDNETSIWFDAWNVTTMAWWQADLLHLTVLRCPYANLQYSVPA